MIFIPTPVSTSGLHIPQSPRFVPSWRVTWSSHPFTPTSDLSPGPFDPLFQTPCTNIPFAPLLFHSRDSCIAMVVHTPELPRESPTHWLPRLVHSAITIRLTFTSDGFHPSLLCASLSAGLESTFWCNQDTILDASIHAYFSLFPKTHSALTHLFLSLASGVFVQTSLPIVLK